MREAGISLVVETNEKRTISSPLSGGINACPPRSASHLRIDAIPAKPGDNGDTSPLVGRSAWIVGSKNECVARTGNSLVFEAAE